MLKFEKANVVHVSFNDLRSKDRFVQIIEWVNCEGYDITIDDKPVISLTDLEFDMITLAINTMRVKSYIEESQDGE